MWSAWQYGAPPEPEFQIDAGDVLATAYVTDDRRLYEIVRVNGVAVTIENVLTPGTVRVVRLATLREDFRLVKRAVSCSDTLEQELHAMH